MLEAERSGASAGRHTRHARLDPAPAGGDRLTRFHRIGLPLRTFPAVPETPPAPTRAHSEINDLPGSLDRCRSVGLSRCLSSMYLRRPCMHRRTRRTPHPGFGEPRHCWTMWRELCRPWRCPTPTVSPIVFIVFRRFQAVCNGCRQFSLLHPRPFRPTLKVEIAGSNPARVTPKPISKAEPVFGSCLPGPPEHAAAPRAAAGGAALAMSFAQHFASHAGPRLVSHAAVVLGARGPIPGPIHGGNGRTRTESYPIACARIELNALT